MQVAVQGVFFLECTVCVGVLHGFLGKLSGELAAHPNYGPGPEGELSGCEGPLTSAKYRSGFVQPDANSQMFPVFQRECLGITSSPWKQAEVAQGIVVSEAGNANGSPPPPQHRQ